MAVAWADCVLFGTPASKNNRSCQQQFQDQRCFRISFTSDCDARPSKHQVVPTTQSSVHLLQHKYKTTHEIPGQGGRVPASDTLISKAGTFKDASDQRTKKSQ